MLTNNAKDTNNKDSNHYCNTRPISTRWKHQLEKMLGMRINHPALNKSTLAKKVMENMPPIDHGKPYGEREHC